MLAARYLLSALAVGAIADWGSETLFWSAPPTPVMLWERLLTILAYSACAGAVLSAVALTGVSGLRATFLGGAMLGFLVEGVVVGTMYDAFPVQLVWTPLAWHALVTGVAVFGFGRMAGRLGPLRMAGGWATLGLFGGIWAQFWPIERDLMPGFGATLGYLLGLGLVVPPAHMVLDRIGIVPRPVRWVLLVLPGVAVAVWLAGTVLAPSPVRIACPVMIGLTVLAMWRPGQRSGTDAAGRIGAGPVSFGPPAASPWHHALFLITPVLAGVLAVPGWRMFDGLEVNVPVALLTGGVALIWWLRLVIRGGRAMLAGNRPA